MTERRDSRRKIALGAQLVQTATAHAQLLGPVDARYNQHGNRITVGLRHCGQYVGHARSGYNETHSGLACDAGISVRHESGALLMSWCDMANSGRRQPTVQLNRVDTRNPKNQL